MAGSKAFNFLSFRGACEASEPGIQKRLRTYPDSGPALRAARNDSYFFAFTSFTSEKVMPGARSLV
jgi:hypothetical protein